MCILGEQDHPELFSAYSRITPTSHLLRSKRGAGGGAALLGPGRCPTCLSRGRFSRPCLCSRSPFSASLSGISDPPTPPVSARRGPASVSEAGEVDRDPHPAQARNADRSTNTQGGVWGPAHPRRLVCSAKFTKRTRASGSSRKAAWARAHVQPSHFRCRVTFLNTHVGTAHAPQGLGVSACPGRSSVRRGEMWSAGRGWSKT